MDPQPGRDHHLRVVVADDSLFRVGLSRMLAKHGIEVVAQTGSTPKLVHLVAMHRPDVVLLGIRMAPHTDEGRVAAAEIRRTQPGSGPPAARATRGDAAGPDAARTRRRCRLSAQGPARRPGCVLLRAHHRGPRRLGGRSRGGLGTGRLAPPGPVTAVAGCRKAPTCRQRDPASLPRRQGRPAFHRRWACAYAPKPTGTTVVPFWAPRLGVWCTNGRLSPRRPR